MPDIFDQKINTFVAAVRSEFIQAQMALYPTTEMPWGSFTQEIPSTQRIEVYPLSSAPPRVKKWLGKRSYAEPDLTNYKLENIEFDVSFQFKKRDIEDDTVGNYKAIVGAAAADVPGYAGREVMKAMRDNNICFDGSAFFGSIHNLGVGDNDLTFSAAASGTGTHTIISLITNSSMKPVIWQKRKDKGLKDNSARDAEESKQLRFWYDLEGAAGLAFWWCAVRTTITNKPTIAELQDVFENIELAFRGFRLDKEGLDDDEFFIHEQMVFNEKSIVHIVNPAISNRVNAVLTNALYAGAAGQTLNNDYVGHGTMLVSSHLGA
jgi:phage major head subunit gpT-like protein